MLVYMERYRDGDKAVELYGERERQYADQPHMEVVLLGADSEEAIRVTHRLYFRDFEAEPFSMEEFERHLPWLAAGRAAGQAGWPRPVSSGKGPCRPWLLARCRWNWAVRSFGSLRLTGPASAGACSSGPRLPTTP